MEEIIKAYQRYCDIVNEEPESLIKGIDFLEFVKENLCSEDAQDGYKNYWFDRFEKGDIHEVAMQYKMEIKHLFSILCYLHTYTQVTKKVCEKVADTLAHSTEERKNLYQGLFNDIKIWKF